MTFLNSFSKKLCVILVCCSLVTVPSKVNPMILAGLYEIGIGLVKARALGMVLRSENMQTAYKAGCMAWGLRNAWKNRPGLETLPKEDLIHQEALARKMIEQSFADRAKAKAPTAFDNHKLLGGIVNPPIVRPSTIPDGIRWRDEYARPRFMQEQPPFLQSTPQNESPISLEMRIIGNQSMHNPPQNSPMVDEMRQLLAQSRAIEVQRALDPGFRRDYDKTIENIFKTILGANSKTATPEELAMHRLNLVKYYRKMDGMFGVYLDYLIYWLQPLFFEKDGKLKFPKRSHKASELILGFCKDGMTEEAYKSLGVEVQLACAREILNEGLAKRVVKKVANLPHNIIESFTSYKDLNRTIAENKFNADVPAFIKACTQRDFKTIRTLLATHHNDRFMLKLMNETYQEYAKVFNQYHIPHALEQDPLWQSMTLDQKELLRDNRAAAEKLAQQLTTRDAFKKSLEAKLKLAPNISKQLEPLTYKLVDALENPRAQYNAITAFVKDHPVIEGVDINDLFFDQRGVMRFLGEDAFVNSLQSWPATINADQKSLLNMLLITKQAAKQSDHPLLNLALQDLHDSLQPGASTTGVLSKAVCHTFTRPESNQVLRILGSLHEKLPTELQQSMQRQLQTVLSNGLSCFEKVSGEFVFDATHDQLFTDFVQKIEQIRKANSEGNVALAAELLNSTATLFNSLSSDSATVAQQEAFKTFFHDNGVSKLFDAGALPSFSTDLAKAENLEIRNFVNNCIALQQNASAGQGVVLDHCLKLLDQAITYPPFKKDNLICARNLFENLVRNDAAGSLPKTSQALMALKSLSLVGGSQEDVLLHRDALRILDAGIKQYGWGGPQGPHDDDLAGLIDTVGNAIKTKNAGDRHNALGELLADAKSLGVVLESAVPLSLKLRPYVTRRNALIAGGTVLVGGAAVGGGIQQSASMARPNVVRHEEPATQVGASRETSSAAAGSPMQEPPSDDEPSSSDDESSEDDESYDSDSSSDDEAEAQMSEERSVLMHIFSSEEGHLPDTLVNRGLLQDLVKAKNYLGTDIKGNRWYGRRLPHGKQLWARAHNGVIRDGGLNEVIKIFHPITGLCRLRR